MADNSKVFTELSSILRKNAKGMRIKRDEPDCLYIESSKLDEKGKPKFFGAVQVKKSYVAYHLMPIYEHPELFNGISDALRKHMQGKSCFNFTDFDKALFVELDRLTAKAVTLTGLKD